MSGTCPGCGDLVMPEYVKLKGDTGPGSIQRGVCEACGKEPIEYIKAKANAELRGLRDRMAMAALTGIMSLGSQHLSIADKTRLAYEIADRMMIERKRCKAKTG